MTRKCVCVSIPLWCNVWIMKEGRSESGAGELAYSYRKAATGSPVLMSLYDGRIAISRYDFTINALWMDLASILSTHTVSIARTCYLEQFAKGHVTRGVRRGSTKCDIVSQGGGGRDPKFVTSHFKNSIKAILHVSTKLKQFHWKALNIAHWTLQIYT